MSTELAAFLTAWSPDPVIVLGVALTAGLYARGWRRLRGARALTTWRPACFAGGLMAVVLALLSPIGVYSERLFSLHMVQHLLLVNVAAPLLLLGAPLLPVVWALPAQERRGLGRLVGPRSPLGRLFHILTYPLVSAPLFLLTLALWHAPALYDAAQGRTLLHDLEHALFLGTALLYWSPIVHPGGGRRRLPYQAVVLYVLPAFFLGNALGALIGFAERPYSATYRDLPPTWGLSALEDQQLAGLIMWMPGGMMYLIPTLLALALAFRPDESARHAEPARLPGAGGAVRGP